MLAASSAAVTGGREAPARPYSISTWSASRGSIPLDASRPKPRRRGLLMPDPIPETVGRHRTKSAAAFTRKLSPLLEIPPPPCGHWTPFISGLVWGFLACFFFLPAQGKERMAARRPNLQEDSSPSRFAFAPGSLRLIAPLVFVFGKRFSFFFLLGFINLSHLPYYSLF